MVTNSKFGIFELKRYLGSLSQSMYLPNCTILIYHQIINILHFNVFLAKHVLCDSSLLMFFKFCVVKGFTWFMLMSFNLHCRNAWAFHLAFAYVGP
ncbi:hypothetical protein HanXRQr2_Chr03g0124421 [Helianthus annuus]|uniref:Uncharacterized protein n=2 Tax=Helianthus annuus TaxID=4232 RepID=A0A9K3JIF3_HELAN|nr:hypothetical protein HanXRQr2_Chr03g0124421 [Helianthus annuus]